VFAIVPIFASENPTEGGLYAVLYEGCEDNCFDELLLHLGGAADPRENWDKTWLNKMVDKNWEALKKWPYSFRIKEDVIIAIQNEAIALRKSLAELTLRGHTSETANLCVVFKPLDPSRKHNIVELDFNKAAYKSKTPRFQHPLIRFYALRIDEHPNLFVIVGGSIKASGLAQHTKMLSRQLSNLGKVGRALKASNVTVDWFDNQTFEIPSCK
jgi:hypothetical protein